MALSGILGAPLGALKTLLANTPEFQTFCGVETAAAAEAYIYTVYADYGDSTKHNRTIVTFDNWKGSRDAASSGLESFKINSSLSLIIESELSSRALSTSIIETFLNSVSAISAGILKVSGQSGMMLINDISLADIPEPDMSSETPVFTAVFKIEWGY